jgi:hypothetical protein
MGYKNATPSYYQSLAVEYQQVRMAEARRLIMRRRLLQHLILKSHAFRIVLLEPLFRGIHICEYLDVVFVADLPARVDVNENGHWSLVSLRRPQ